jgi:serine/threonine protein kinase
MYKIDEKNNVTGVLIDYGLCSYNPKNKPFISQHPRITQSYEAPENFKEFKKDGSEYFGEYDKSSDIWSLGMSFCEVMNNNRHITKRFKRSNDNRKYLIQNFNEDKIEKTLEDTVFSYAQFPNDEEKRLFKDLIVNMLMINPNERYNVDQIILHKYWTSNPKTLILGVINCSEVPIENYSLQYINQLNLLGVYEVTDFCRNELADLPLEVFFIAIDIYLRVCSKCEFNEFMTSKKIKNLANYCCLIAYKYFNWSEVEEELHYDIEDINIDEEIQIYKALEGKIHTERYFRAAETFEDLINVFNGLIFPIEEHKAYFEIGNEQFTINKNIVNYLNQDAKTYILSQRKKEFKPVNKHELKVSDFFE